MANSPWLYNISIELIAKASEGFSGNKQCCTLSVELIHSALTYLSFHMYITGEIRNFLIESTEAHCKGYGYSYLISE